MDNIIEIKNIRKSYKRLNALDDISLNIKKGGVTGILGPNGSGKTTLIKLILGLIQENSGEIIIDGDKPGPEARAKISFLPDNKFLYDWMKIDDAFKFYQDFFQDFNLTKAERLLDFMDLDKKMYVKNLSKGMHEKLNLTLTLGRDAKIFILDEPIAGVDPVARDQILEAIISSYLDDSTMIITTHLVRDMESIFDDVVYIKEGKVELEGKAEDLRDKYNLSIDGLYKHIFGGKIGGSHV